MAQADGHVAEEELAVLERASRIFVEKNQIPSWADALTSPQDIVTLAKEIPYDYRLTTATMAFMVIASSRDVYQFAVNAQEQNAFDQLCDALMLSEEEILSARVEATNEMNRKPGLWESITRRIPGLL